MNYELVKNEFIKLKKESLDYIDNVAKISSNKILSEYEKLEIYRNSKNYEVKLNEMAKKLFGALRGTEQFNKMQPVDVIIEFDLDKNCLSSLKDDDDDDDDILEDLGIDVENFKFKLTLKELMGCRRYTLYRIRKVDFYRILNKQELIENPIYIFKGIYDASEDCYGPCFGKHEDYLYGIYQDVCSDCYDQEVKEVRKKDMSDFEKDKTVIHSKRYVDFYDIILIFEEELLNIQNNTINDCVIATKKRVEELNYTRSPEYKEKVLLDKINELYKKVKGEFIQKEILYSGNFLSVLEEMYKLPNGNTVQKEKVVKNGGKNSVIVIAINEEKEYIIIFQNRIKDEMIAEFPSGYIEIGEDPIEAAKRELKEETGYITDDLFIVDEAYTSPGIDNSITYIVVANNCIKTDEKTVNGTELIDYGLFSEKELRYLIDKNIMNGAMNKLAYYNLVNNVEDCNTISMKSNKKIYKQLRKKTNPLDK